MTGARYRSERLNKLHEKDSFSCGVTSLDRYLHQQAGQDQRRHVSVSYVLTEASTGALVGFYTLSACSIVPQNLPAELIEKLPRYDTLPAILVGRLAEDKRYQERGVGKLLLLDALARCLAVSHDVGALAVVVHAKNETARGFYVHQGFLQLADHENHLYLPMATAERLGI